LCLQVGLLAESHYLPKAHYKTVRNNTGGKSSFVGGKESIDTTRQVKKYLLCDLCEDRFNRCGENWVMANCLTPDGSFPMRDALTQATPTGTAEIAEPHRVQHIAAYSGISTPGIDIDKLVYFGVSVFWRAAVTDWSLLDRTLVRISLGPYEDELREFLMGQATFPKNMTLIIYVSSEANPLTASCFPFGVREGTYRRYSFNMSGLAFRLSVGKTIPSEVREVCAASSPSRTVILSDMGDPSLYALFIELLQRQKGLPRGA
jgi:hypothetical protein